MFNLYELKAGVDIQDLSMSITYKINHGKHLEIVGENEFINDKIVIIPYKEGYKIEREIKNVSNNTLKLKELFLRIDDINFGENKFDDYYYTVENLRLFENITIPVDFDRINLKSFNGARQVIANTRLVDNGVLSNRINSSPYMPYHAILLSNYNSEKGIVHGSLSQDYFYHNYKLFHEENKLIFEIYSSFKSVGYREFAKNEILTDISYICEINNASDINFIFDKYNAALRENLKCERGSGNQNRHTLIWDSWNDGIFRDVSEEMLVKEAKAVKKYFPNVEWFQLDDGYATYCEKNVDLDAHGLGVPYETDGVDKIKFPNGLKGYTDKIKEIGLRPSIWIGGFCPIKSKIYKEHKDWFIDFNYRCNFSQPLDVSQEQVREYMVTAFKALTKDVGFEGVKHDFWSYAFEESHDNLKYKNKSGYEYREWWQKEVIRNLPNDGYVQTGCDTSSGNVFLGKYFNNYRFGDDIGSGKWFSLLITSFWATAILSIHCGDLFIPNSDSIAILNNLSDTDFMFWINFVLISRTMCEISGRFSKVDSNDKRLKILQKASCSINNGEDVYFLGFDYRKPGMISPNVMYINSPYFTYEYDESSKKYLPVKTLGIFNYDERDKEIKFNLNDLNIKGNSFFLIDIWSGEIIKTDKLDLLLKPHESKVYTVCLENDFAICDSNVELKNVKIENNVISCNIQSCNEISLIVLGKVNEVILNNKTIDFNQERNKLAFSTMEYGELQIKF